MDREKPSFHQPGVVMEGGGAGWTYDFQGHHDDDTAQGVVEKVKKPFVQKWNEWNG